MTKLSQHGDFPRELIESTKAEMRGELDFAEQEEPSKRSQSGYPSFGNVLGHGFDFGEEPPSNFYSADLRRLRDALKIAKNNVGTGYDYGTTRRIAELRGKIRDLLAQQYRNLEAAQAALGNPYGSPDDCCTGTPGEPAGTAIKAHIDNRGALIPEYKEDEEEWAKAYYEKIKKGAEIQAKIEPLYQKYEHEVRMMRYPAADAYFKQIVGLGMELQKVWGFKDEAWDAQLKSLETKIADATSYMDRLDLQAQYMKAQSKYYKDFDGMPGPDPATQKMIPPMETTLGGGMRFSEMTDIANDVLDYARRNWGK